MKPPRMDKEQIGWIQGVVWAAAFMAADHNEESFAAEIFQESGISKKDASYACEYDLARLRRAVLDLPKGVD